MSTDKNKNITAIAYNHLNLPKKITFGTTGSIEYIYSAAGEKLEKIVTEGTTVTTTNYLDGFQYKNTVLEFFPTAEGYVKNTAGVYSYVFQYKDHLGNVRLSYAKSPTTNVLEIIEENNYYPFGLKHKGYNDYAANNNKYKYNGKELQDENIGGSQLNWYDYEARNYDPALGGWMNIDPLAENSRRWTPYNYAYNNPICFIDPDGMEATTYYGADAQELFKALKAQSSHGNDGEFERDENGNWVKTSTAGDDIGVDFYHTEGTDKKGRFAQTTYVTDRKGNWNTISGGRNALMGYLKRNNNIDWQDIYNEWKEGTGNEKSLFEGNHPANKYIQNNYLFSWTLDKFIESGDSKGAYPVDFGLTDIFWSGVNMQAQMMGSYNASFYKLGNKTLALLMDSKSRTSMYYHLPFTNYSRGTSFSTGIKKGTNIYQTYLFFTKQK